MPTIPRYDGPQIQQAGIPNARQDTLSGATPDGAFGEGLARGLGNAGVVLQKAQDDADKVRVFEARNKLQNAVNDSLYGKDGVFNRKGKNAANAATQWETDFDTVAQEIGTDLTPRQREMYEQAAAEIRTPHRRQVLNYETDQWRAVEDETYVASAETSLSTIGLNWNNPEVIARELAVMDGAIIKKNQTRGSDAEVANLERQKWTSQAHAQVAASALAAGNLQYAKEYFEQNREQMMPQERLRLEATINAESSKEQGLTGAQEAFSAAPNDMQAGMTMLRDKFKGDIPALEYAQSELKSMYAEGDIVRRQQQDKALDASMNALARVRQTGRVPTLKDIPREALDALDPEKKFGLMNTLDALAERARNDAKERRSEAEKQLDKQRSMQAAARFYQLVNDPDLKSTNLLSEASTFLTTSVGEKYFGQLVSAQRDLRKGKSDALTQIQGDTEMVNGYLKSLGLKDDDQAKVAAFTTFQRKLSSFEASKGSKATPEEKRKMAQDMFIKREIETGWFTGGSDVNKAPFQMTTDEIARIRDINSVPKSEQEAIRNDYRSVTGRDPTPKEITELYRQSILQAR